MKEDISTKPGRFSRKSSLKFLTNKLVLDDGQEVFVNAESPLFEAVHPPHADINSLLLARTITNLSLASSPATLGTSLGISFLVSGLLSAYQNGIKDFFWGGINGSGLSFLENMFRKQPDIFLEKGAIIPFILKEDLKVSKGIQKEKTEFLNVSKEQAKNEIEKLLKWGNLAGAVEYAHKAGQVEIYNELMKKISL